jgi:membrane associated rhomboid family serine protease
MVFPIGDDNTGRQITPYVNYLFIAVNLLVFIFLQGLGTNDRFTYAFSAVPEEIVTGEDLATGDRTVVHPVAGEVTIPGLQPTPLSVYLTLLTSMFMHGGLAHIFGNMLFLWIFGDNVEDDLGHKKYFIFYITCGVLASLAHVFSTYFFAGNPRIPSLGASGAISGVLGGYLVLHPHRRVTVILLRVLTQVPAIVAIGMWFLFQIVSSLGVLGSGSQEGGVAYGAHIGGFIAGLVLVKLFAGTRKANARS